MNTLALMNPILRLWGVWNHYFQVNTTGYSLTQSQCNTWELQKKHDTFLIIFLKICPKLYIYIYSLDILFSWLIREKFWCYCNSITNMNCFPSREKFLVSGEYIVSLRFYKWPKVNIIPGYTKIRQILFHYISISIYHLINKHCLEFFKAVKVC